MTNPHNQYSEEGYSFDYYVPLYGMRFTDIRHNNNNKNANKNNKIILYSGW